MELVEGPTFQVLSVEQTSSKRISLVWRTRYQTASGIGQTLVTCEVSKVIPACELPGGGTPPRTVALTTQDGFGQTGVINEERVGYEFTPGETYTVSLGLRAGEGFHVTSGWVELAPMSVTFIKDYDVADLRRFMERCITFAKLDTAKSRMDEIATFYRNKPGDYFRYIACHRSNVMEVYPKDHNGHRGSPINGRLPGLFFSANFARTSVSPFGDRRLFVPSQLLLNDAGNLYFADFYCTNANHYVTLVVTRRHTEADAFCARRLVALDTRRNPFLQLVDAGGAEPAVWAVVCSQLHLEVLYTESLDLAHLLDSGAEFVNTETTGSSRPGGIRRSKFCCFCDLD